MIQRECPPCQTERPTCRRAHVLVVDDDPYTCELQTVQAVLRNAMDTTLVAVIRGADRDRLIDLRRSIGGREDLDAVERAELEQAMDERFCVLNQEAVARQKLRWIWGKTGLEGENEGANVRG